VEDEISQMLELREHNYQKWLEDDGSAEYCVCQTRLSKFMIRCELCYEWYHPTCVPLSRARPKRNANTNATNAQSVSEDGTEILRHEQDTAALAAVAHSIASSEKRFLGPCCQRSKRPNPIDLQPLVKSVNKLSVRLYEGVALLLLMDRFVTWIEKANAALQHPEISAALQAMEDAAAIGGEGVIKKAVIQSREPTTPTTTTNIPPTTPSTIKKEPTFEKNDGNKVSEEANVDEPSTGNQNAVGEGGYPESVHIKMEVVDREEDEGNELIEKMKVEEDCEHSAVSASGGLSSIKQENQSSPPSVSRAFAEPKINLSREVSDVVEKLLVEIQLIEMDAGDKPDLLWKLWNASRVAPFNEWTQDVSLYSHSIIIQLFAVYYIILYDFFLLAQEIEDIIRVELEAKGIPTGTKLPLVRRSNNNKPPVSSATKSTNEAGGPNRLRKRSGSSSIISDASASRKGGGKPPNKRPKKAPPVVAAATKRRSTSKASSTQEELDDSNVEECEDACAADPCKRPAGNKRAELIKFYTKSYCKCKLQISTFPSFQRTKM
jgi:hypothetical protein